jgi:AraC family transcriptional regulator
VQDASAVEAMFGSTLAKVFNAQQCECQLEGSQGKREFAVTRLRSGASHVAQGAVFPVDDALLAWVALKPTAIGQWRGRYNGREVGVTRVTAFATTALDLRRSMEMWTCGPFDYLCYFLAGSLLERVAFENELSTAYDLREVFFVEDIVIAQLTRSIVSAARRGEPFDTLRLDQTALLLSAHVLQRYCSSKKAPTFATRGLQTWQRLRAEEILRSRLEGNIALGEIAAACSLSVSHFARSFRRSFGISVHQYLIRLRIERAKALLANTSKPFAEVAQLSGFCDQSAFTRAFTRVERTTPSLWRKCNGQPCTTLTASRTTSRTKRGWESMGT